MILAILFSLLTCPLQSSAFILKPSSILQKVVENSGNGVYQIEQEVQFPAMSPTLQDALVLKETWQVENENKMRLIVNGTKELAQKIHWVFVYENGHRVYQGPRGRNSQNIGDDFIEKYFHFRKADRLANAVSQLRMVPASLFNKKNYRLNKDPDVISDPHVHLSRVGGVIVYGLGIPTDVGAEPNPAMYIDQDQFLIRKFRLPSQVEVFAENYSSFAKGLSFPRHRSVRWGEESEHQLLDKQVNIQTLHVQSKPEKNFPLVLEPSTSMDVPELGSSKGLVEEFYARFR